MLKDLYKQYYLNACDVIDLYRLFFNYGLSTQRSHKK